MALDEEKRQVQLTEPLCEIYWCKRPTKGVSNKVCSNNCTYGQQQADRKPVHRLMSCIRSLCVWNHVLFGRARISSRCSSMFCALFAFSSVTRSSFSSLSASSIAWMSSSSRRIRSRYFSITSTASHRHYHFSGLSESTSREPRVSKLSFWECWSGIFKYKLTFNWPLSVDVKYKLLQTVLECTQ